MLNFGKNQDSKVSIEDQHSSLKIQGLILGLSMAPLSSPEIYEAHPASYSMRTSSSFPRDKAAST